MHPGAQHHPCAQAAPGPAFPLHRDLRLAPGTRRIVHLDVDAFLASVEQALHPELRGRPVIVGGMPSERNLVMSASYEARAHGVRPGMLLAEAARRLPRAIFRRGDSQAAARLREKTAHLLRQFTPAVEVASIDDFFADLEGCAPLCGSAFDAAERMRARIRAEVELPVTIGIGTSKMLARLAGKLAKPGGIAEILPGYEPAFLARLPVEHLPGVGHSIGALLERFQIRTASELRRVSREVLFATFGRAGLVLHERARGIDGEPVEPTYAEDEHGRLVARAPRTIRRDSTFEPEEGRREIVEAMLAYLVDRAAFRLRGHRHAAGSLEVRIVYVRGRGDEEDAAPAGASGAARRRALSSPSDSTDELTRHALELLRSLPRRRALVKRVGVTFVDLVPSSGWQGRLFSDPPAEREGALDLHLSSRADRQRRLDSALDRLRARHGFGLLLRGATLPLCATSELTRDGFRLRTPSLNQ
jgi:DNA polymerase-4